MKDRMIAKSTMKEFISDYYANMFLKATNRFDAEGIPINWKGVAPGVLKDQGIVLARVYAHQKLPYLRPVGIEVRTTKEISGIPFVAIADVLEEGDTIDHKLTTKRYSENYVRNDLQATAYWMIWERPFCWHLALNQKNPTIETVWAHRTAKDMDFFTRLVIKVDESIKSGIFPPNPTSTTCSEDYCGYWAICRDRLR